MIASEDVGPNVTGKWCVAWQSSRQFWDKHCINGREAMIMLMGESIPTEKVCIGASSFEDMIPSDFSAPTEVYDVDGSMYLHEDSLGDFFFNIWDVNNEKDTVEPEDLPEEVLDIIAKGLSNVRLVLDEHDRDLKKYKDIIKKRKN